MASTTITLSPPTQQQSNHHESTADVECFCTVLYSTLSLARIGCVWVKMFNNFQQRIYITIKTDSTPPPPIVLHSEDSPNLSPPALSAVIQTDRKCSILQTKQVRGWVRRLNVRRRGVLSVLRKTYILWNSLTVSGECSLPWRTTRTRSSPDGTGSRWRDSSWPNEDDHPFLNLMTDTCHA